MRTIPLYLAIGAILICPYACALRDAAAQSLHIKWSACCEKCRVVDQCEESPSGDDCGREHLPKQPTPSDDGKSCFCGGAIFDASTRASADVVQPSFILSCVADVAEMPAFAGLSELVSCTAPPFDNYGRLSVRLAIGSLLL